MSSNIKLKSKKQYKNKNLLSAFSEIETAETEAWTQVEEVLEALETNAETARVIAKAGIKTYRREGGAIETPLAAKILSAL